MELHLIVERLVQLFTPTVPYLLKHGLPEDLHLDTYSLLAASQIWRILSPLRTSHHELRICLEAFGRSPEDEDRRRALGSQIETLLKENASIYLEIKSILSQLKSVEGLSDRTVLDGLTERSDILGRLEILKLLRSGIEPQRIAERFEVAVDDIFSINYGYSVGGVASAVVPEGIPSWLQQLDEKEPLLRRLEMVRLLRAGTPARVVAQQFGALEDYVLLLAERFATRGLPGVVTEDDLERFRSVTGDEIRVCSYNVQGVRSDGSFRFRRMARELSRYRPDLMALQEVVSGAGVEDTGGQIARWLSAITGEHYRSHFAYCHQFMDRYPEGVAVCGRVPVRILGSIDLTTDLAKGLRPIMDRRAQVAEIALRGKTIILVSTHLDHVGAGEVRLAQVEKLVSELDKLTRHIDYYALIIAGDLNDKEDSAALRHIKNAGYRDSYRICHNNGGDTFPVPKPTVRIDYIFVKGQAQIVSAEVILNNPDLSDHLGVVAVLK